MNEMNINAEYLDFKSFEEVLEYQNRLLGMSDLDAKLKILSAVAKKSTWYQLLLRYSEDDYKTAQESGTKSLSSDTDFGYISLEEYYEFLESKKNYALKRTALPLFLGDKADKIPEEIISKYRTITGFDSIAQVYENNCKLQNILNLDIPLSYTIIRDEKKESEEVRKEKELELKRKKIRFKELPKEIEYMQNDIKENKLYISGLQKQIDEEPDYLKKAEKYSLIAEYAESIGNLQRTLELRREFYEELRAELDLEQRPTNIVFEETVGMNRIVEGVISTKGIDANVNEMNNSEMQI